MERGTGWRNREERKGELQQARCARKEEKTKKKTPQVWSGLSQTKSRVTNESMIGSAWLAISPL